MSFILNALRKSEEERQSAQPENLRDRIQERSNNTKKKSKLWLVILFLTNLVLLSYFIWVFIIKEEFNKNEQPTEITKTKEIINHTRVIKLSAIKTTDIQNTTNIENILVKTKAKPTKNESQISITQLVENKKHPLQPIKKIVPVVKTTAQLRTPSKNKSTTNIPFLSDLSPRFRQSVPDILINVFIYVEKEEDRLIMINAKTYRVGQEIINNMKLKEIRKKSIVVKYKNKTFQIRR